MAYNLDHLDTPVPAEGAEFEFRGQVFRLRRYTIEEQFDKDLIDSVKYMKWETIDELKKMFQVRMFTTKKDFDRFWRTITTKYTVDGVSKAPLRLSELTVLGSAMLDISNGTYDPDTGTEDPKDGES